jgi:uncharacterized protein YndB with AHSA1/START domain
MKGDPLATLENTSDLDVVRCELFIAAPAGRVFQAITDPRQLPQWWGNQGMYRVTKLESDLRPHGKWSSSGVMTNGDAFTVSGEYLEIDPPRLLVQTWMASYMTDLVTTVRWELTPQNNGTLVKITHRGFAGKTDAAKSYGGGWKRVLGWVQGFVEKGETIDTRP